jgi:RNA polymerase sigma factor (sigma-70 family)
LSREVFLGDRAETAVGAARVAEDRSAADALSQLYARIAPSAMGFAYALCSGDRPQAEDLFHDTFLRCSRRSDLIADSAAFERYLRRSMVNGLVDLTRREGSRRRWLQRQPRMRAVPDEQAVVADRDRLVRALRELPPRQRAAVVVRICLDLSEAETAEVLRCSVGNVKSLTSRGLAALRLVMEKEACDG